MNTQNIKDGLFYHLIRISLGIECCAPSLFALQEWQPLFELAKKHAIVGVCFSGLTRIKANMDNCATIPQKLYMAWLAATASIQSRNKVMDRRCAELQRMLTKKGFRCCVLKGQGAAQLYDEQLKDLRQSGDIDVWITPDNGVDYEKHFRKVMRFAKSIAPVLDFNKQHVAIPIFKDVETEVHFTPSIMFNPQHNARLQKWFVDNSHLMHYTEEGFTIPTPSFNVVYMLQHCYNHLLFEGVGLRQVMDYYYVLKALTLNEDEKTKLRNTLRRLGLLKFASAMMWVQQEVFHLDHEKMICCPNEKEGRFFLDEIMMGGNFGQYGSDDVMRKHGKGNVSFFVVRMKRNIRFIKHYPSEILWSPFGMLAHKYWKHKALKNISTNL